MDHLGTHTVNVGDTYVRVKRNNNINDYFNNYRDSYIIIYLDSRSAR